MPDDYRSSTDPGVQAVRGIRNNNPGNMRDDGSAWQGLVADDANGFMIFADMGWGTRALGKDLTNKITTDGLNTISTLITKYAPPSENDTNAYISSVSADTGIAANATLAADTNTIALLIRAIANHENGDQASATYLTDDDISAGLALMNGTVTSLIASAPVYFQANPVEAISIIVGLGFMGYMLFKNARRK